jgi:hypothetical protein
VTRVARVKKLAVKRAEAGCGTPPKRIIIAWQVGKRIEEPDGTGFHVEVVREIREEVVLPGRRADGSPYWPDPDELAAIRKAEAQEADD